MRWALPLLSVMLISACSAMWRWEPIDGGQASGSSTRAAGPGEYRVRSGDTMYSIAFRHNLDFRELARWNGVGSDYLIFPGQILRLTPPGGGPPSSSPPIVARAPAPASAPRPGSGSASPPPSNKPAAVVVKPKPGPEAAALPTGPYRWAWPASGAILRGFSLPASKGLDISGALGSPVYTAAPGRVVYSGSALKGYGELIIIKHDEVFLSAYGYNRRRLVEEGDLVAAGQQIGEIGLGPESKPLLHFEIRKAGQPTNPLPLLPRR